MKAMILAGGTGSRLFPLTLNTNKHLLNAYFQPIINYPLMSLMAAGYNEIIFVSNPRDLGSFRQLFGDGSQLGMKFDYAPQKTAGGLPHAIASAKKYVRNEPFAVMLGDTYFQANEFKKIILSANKKALNRGCTILLVKVSDGRSYGVAKMRNRKIVELVEKPSSKTFGRKDFAMGGFYIFDQNVFDYIELLSPSRRGELEMVDLLTSYFAQNYLRHLIFPRSKYWYDFGNIRDLHKSAMRISGSKLPVFTPEYLAFKNNWITINELHRILDRQPVSFYKTHIFNLLKLDFYDY
jgi:glucose-1-phosphate thymidylyltransferase